MEEGKKPENWEEVYKMNLESQADKSKELVSEMLSDAEKRDDKNRRTIKLLVISNAITVILLVVVVLYSLYMWNSYDYVSQGGDGYNYYNEDVEGDILNGTADQEKEE